MRTRGREEPAFVLMPMGGRHDWLFCSVRNEPRSLRKSQERDGGGEKDRKTRLEDFMKPVLWVSKVAQERNNKTGAGVFKK